MDSSASVLRAARWQLCSGKIIRFLLDAKVCRISVPGGLSHGAVEDPYEHTHLRRQVDVAPAQLLSAGVIAHSR